MSQPLRWAYISIVIAVQEASAAASSSCGLGPRSSPPASSGSSAVSVWPPALTSWVNFSRWRATAASPRVAATSIQESHQSNGLNTMPVRTLGKK